MRISVKMVLSVVCLLAVMVLYLGCQESNAPATGVKTEAKEAKPAVKAEVKEAKPEVKPEAKAEVPETKPAAPEAKAMVAEPNAGKVAAEDNGIAATVNGIVIKDADVDAKVSTYMERMAAQIPPNMVEQYRTQIRGQALESMIVEQLLAEQVKKEGINITDKDVNDKLNEIIAAQPGGMTMESFKAMLAAQGQSFDVVKEQIKKTLGYEKLLGIVEVNDAEAKAFYDENKEDFNKPEQVKASHILVKVAPTATPEEKTAAKAKIDGLLKQVKGGGDFAALAKENSDDPGSKIMGGDLGFFDRNTMVKEFADAAFAMKVGQVSNVVETQYGYHIIKVTDRKEGGLTSFDKAKADIVRSLQDKKKNELFRQLIEKVKAGAKIEYPPGKEPKPRMPMMQRPPRPNTQAPQTQSGSAAPAPK
ncbi:MAG: peptidylprolyl isomerase [Sedimentisphaerales bacterium]|jgi:peptidyl-prolyl cis-trans isomerase C